MPEQNEILEDVRSRGLARSNAGMTVPEGYFDDVSRRIIDALPYRAEAEQAPARPRTVWQKVRPYVYMAAMFAGIWLMLQMFSMMGGQKPLAPMGDNPVLAEALANDDFVFDYLYDDLSTYDIYDQLLEADETADSEYADELPADGSCPVDNLQTPQ